MAHWRPSWPLGRPRWPGFRPPADGRLSELRLGLAYARLLTDADIAASFCRMFDLPPDSAPVVLTVNVPDRILTASFQTAGACVASLYLARPGPGDDAGLQAQIRQAISFAVKAVLDSSSPPAAPRTPTTGEPIRGGRHSLLPPPVPASLCVTTRKAA